MLDRATLTRRFAAGDTWFDSSPLYQVLARRVVDDDELLDLAAQVQAGQQPANMLMAATHLIVLRHREHPFARFFPSVRLAMHEVAQRVDGPITFLEVGPSAGIQLRFDHWALQLAAT